MEVLFFFTALYSFFIFEKKKYFPICFMTSCGQLIESPPSACAAAGGADRGQRI